MVSPFGPRVASAEGSCLVSASCGLNSSDRTCWLSALASTTSCATRWMRSAADTHVPPNLCTCHWWPRGQPAAAACSVAAGASASATAAGAELNAAGTDLRMLNTVGDQASGRRTVDGGGGRAGDRV